VMADSNGRELEEDALLSFVKGIFVKGRFK
jgi:hypothetical protein